MEKDLTGTVVDIKIGHRDHFESIIDKMKLAQIAFQEASMLCRDTNKTLFDFIENTYPETNAYYLSYEHKNHKINILHKKPVKD